MAKNATFYYLVFGHDPKTDQHPQQKVIEYKYTQGREAVLRELVIETVNRWVSADTEGWPANPIPYACKSLYNKMHV